MDVLNRKLLRDITQNKGRSFTIIFIITFSVALYSGFLGTSSSLENNFDRFNDEANLASVRFITNTVPSSEVENLLFDKLEQVILIMAAVGEVIDETFLQISRCPGHNAAFLYPLEPDFIPKIHILSPVSTPNFNIAPSQLNTYSG